MIQPTMNDYRSDPRPRLPPQTHHHQQHQQQIPTPPYHDQAPNPSSRPRPEMPISLAPGVPPMKPDPLPISRIENERKYELEVVQQPRRARMCGFGDKDRRPITPPPCVRLMITDPKTGKEIDCNDIEHSMFVLNVDLWSHDGKGEVNLVRHSSNSPSISASSTLSYTEARPVYTPIQPQQQQQYKNGNGQGQYSPQSFNPYPREVPPSVIPYGSRPGQDFSVSYNHGFGPNDIMRHSQNGGAQRSPQDQQQMFPGAVTAAQIHAQGRSDSYPPPGYQGQQGEGEQQPQNPRQPHSQQPQGMFTRNLIGSLAASAFRLTDTEERIGIWFVLQDLSVRTEGHFRLRFSFVNVGAPPPTSQVPTPGGSNPLSPSNGSQSKTINTGKAPILAQCFSEVFTVYSAKKFPGVVESTPLSKCFATQGIKIPIRKDGPGDKPSKKIGDFEDED